MPGDHFAGALAMSFESVSVVAADVLANNILQHCLTKLWSSLSRGPRLTSTAHKYRCTAWASNDTSICTVTK